MIRGVNRRMPFRGNRGPMMTPRGPIMRPKIFVPHYPFDMVLAEKYFPRARAALDDSELTELLMKRNNDLSPSPIEQNSISNLVTKIQTVLDNLIVNPSGFESCSIEEVRQVGSFKKGTMLRGYNVADIVIILKTLPTFKAIEALGAKIHEEIKILMKSEIITMNEMIAFCVTDYGLDFWNKMAKVRLLITTVPQNHRLLTKELHLDRKVCINHLSAIRHSRWFEENAHHSSVKALIRIMRDLCRRFQGFEALNPWIIDLLVHNCVMNSENEPLPVNVAFRRIFQMLSAGLFLPGSVGITDPCESPNIRVHSSMTLEQQDICCLTAQTLLRILSRNGYRNILDPDTNPSFIDQVSLWNGVVISPLTRVYDANDSKEPYDNEANDGAMSDGTTNSDEKFL